ncbi:non-ribosomal peptide synthetase [Thalassomonas viridans]|uniref:Non-ribosomal peptide synthetase n=1 Tax=Thalassomonas viridans TaxID=137584 RepID=A0AAE9Z9H6_9GAMM|nr:non-ribosomal peptide synthetase [Thalassomonas viridans]WDE09220.1 non-ribosomal peptide synthetase [Thalassomonas viridans]
MNAQSLLAFLYSKGVVLAVEQEDLLIDDVNKILDADIIASIKQHKKALIALINQLNRESAVTIKAEKSPRNFPFTFDCSFSQKRMLFMESLAGEQSFYNMPFAYKISGVLNIPAFNSALTGLLNKYDILRTTYIQREDEYIQSVGPLLSDKSELFVLDVDDISDAGDIELCLQQRLQKEAQYVFDLQAEFPVKAALIKTDKEEFVLSLNIHHIAADGRSARNIIQTINEGYQFHTRQTHAGAADNANIFQYIDYIKWQKQWLHSRLCREAKAYWLETLQDLPELHNFPTDYTRPAVLGVDGDTCIHIPAASLFSKINSVAKQHQTTPFVLIQAVFSAFLARYTDDTDIVFGTAAANRQPGEFIDSVGLFVNTLVLRYTVENGCSLIDLLAQAKLNHKNALRYQQFPFDQLVEELNPKRSLAYNPLVQIMLVMQDDSTDLLDLAGIKTEVLPQSQAVSKFDFTLHVKLAAEKIAFHWEYNRALFKAETIENIAGQFETFLAAALASPAKNIEQIALLPPDTMVPKPDASRFPPPVCIHELFENSVRQAPDAIAVSDGHNALTYRQLNDSAEVVAAHLSHLCDIKGARIAVCMEKSIELVIAMLAVFKAGGVYVPVDPSYPQERIDYMLQDSNVKILLSNTCSRFSLAQSQVDIRLIEDLLARPPVRLDLARVTPEQAAYVIYTSGSTGRPKGVEVPHQSLFYSLQANKLALEFDARDIMPTIGSQAFGVSLLEILLPLISAAQVLIVTKQQVGDIEKLIDHTDKVTVLHAVPSIMSQWLDMIEGDDVNGRYANLRLLLVGAEPVPETLIKKIKQWRPEVTLLVLYGMTESSVVSSSYEATMQTPSGYCMGRPHANTQFYVLNKQRSIQPKGVPGELYVGGLSLATRYLNQAELTAEKFIASPFHQGERLYQTGDRVRCLNDGNYEFLGRVDNQVSLRGVRIELGEIESLAMAIQGVDKVITHVMTMNSGDRVLVLYYTAGQEPAHVPALSEKIKATLANQLPEHMMPSVIQHLPEFPLNPNGKVDRKKLPQPVFNRVITEPANDIEQQLLELWQELLENKQISVEDNFFEIGGHSLIATRLIARVRSHFSVSLPLTALFKSPTIRSCAVLLEEILKEEYSRSLINQDSAGENAELVDEIII